MSPRRKASSPGPRLGVPALFTEGRFEQVLIMTFGADLEFYERVLRRHFGGFRNQIVLLDGEQLDRTVAPMAGSGALRHLNRSWIAGPVRLPHAAHAKLILLAAPSSALLLVGSGNLNIGGYAGAGECFTPYRWSAEDPSDLAAFLAVRELTDGLGQRGHLDAVTLDRLKVFWSAYDWWHQAPAADGPVRHNLDEPLGEQFATLIGGERVEELVVVAPFHDPKCAALERLISRLDPRHVRVLIQPRRSSVDPKQLAKVMKRHRGGVFALEAAGDAAGSYLHAKVFLARTRRRAVCLTGSANCSMVALWAQHPSANIELGNLAVGAPDAFDHLLDPEVVSIVGPVDPLSLNVSLQDDDEDDAPAPSLRVENVRWDAPIISGTIRGTVDESSHVSIEVEGRAVHAVVRLSHGTGGLTRFEARLTDARDLEEVERVAVITVVVDSVRIASMVPYQVQRLREQDRRRVDTERLRHAARLELDDPDLELALAALEEILVGENVARWSPGAQEKQQAEDSDGASIEWADIDWTTVRRHPRFAAYGPLGGLGAIAGSDLAAYLDALSQAVRELAEPELPSERQGSSPAGEDEDDEIDDSELSGGVEGAEVDDVVEEEAEHVSSKRRQSIAARNLRLIRNFVRRNLRALERDQFRDGVGAGIVVPNVIILNWLCWWVATKDEDRLGELAEERLRLWRLLWGTRDSSGYLDELDEEQRALVIERFDDQRVETVMLASIADVWANSDYDDPTFRGLREVVRKAVCHPCWQVTARHLAPACRLVNGRPTTREALDAVSMAWVLWDTACTPLGETEARAAVAAAAGARLGDVTPKDQPVIVDASSIPRPVCEMSMSLPLAAAEVAKVFAAWRGVDDRDYYRLKWTGGVALYRGSEENGWIYTEEDDAMVDLGFIAADDPPWRAELDRLHEAAERLAERAA